MNKALSEHEAKLWKRYGLSISDYLWELEPEHAFAVARIHSAVAGYLEAHPDLRERYLKREMGFLYFDIAELAVGRDVLDMVSKLAAVVSKRLSTRFHHGIEGARLEYAYRADKVSGDGIEGR